MRVLIDGRPTTLDTRRVLGEGGEATVLLHGPRTDRCAVKLYKQPPASDAKLRALASIAPALEGIAALPRAIVSDVRSGAVLGFTMALCEPGCEPLAMLAKPSFRASTGIEMTRLLGIFLQLHDHLAAIHLAGAVVGDLNDQNELFDPRSDALRFIDADSFQVAGFPCAVVTEAYLDPLLYGPDLQRPCATADGKPRWFGRGSDWYAYAALLFRSLTGVHPFGGSTASGRSLAERAHRRESALGNGVTLPRPMRARVAALPEALFGAFYGIFEAGDRRPLGQDLLRDAQKGARVCSCGLELLGGARRCPACTASRAASGVLAVRELARTTGAFVAASTMDACWFAVAREGTRHILVSGRFGEREPQRQTLRTVGPAWVAMDGPHLALAEPGNHAKVTVVDVRTGSTILETATELAFGRPALALRNGVLHRVARGSLIESDLGSGRELARFTVVSEQTLLYPRPAGVFAITAVLGRRLYHALDRASTVELEVDPLARGERLLSESILGDGARTLLLRHVAASGVEWVVTSLFGDTGKAIRSERVAAAARPAGVAIGGGLFAKGAHLVATDGGLVREDVTVPSTSVTFPETAPFVSLDTELMASAFGLVARLGSSLHVLSQKS